jgi:phenylacetate-coenzyme A ligase PaaK-like adenylate-forming protein
LIRLEVTDVVTLDPEPCPCGRSLVRASTVHGRSDDILSLPTRDGPAIAIHPLHFALLTRDPDIVEFQVRQRGPALTVLVVPTRSSDAATAAPLDWNTASSRRLPTNWPVSASTTHR